MNTFNQSLKTMVLAALVAFAFSVTAFAVDEVTEDAKLFASDGNPLDYFGHSVAIDGNFMVAGAYWDDEVDFKTGAIYVYSWDGTSWGNEQKLWASDAASFDDFGRSVDISGNYIVVGSRADDDGANMSGSVYVFYFDGTSWSQQAKITASDPGQYNYFGWSVSISGDYLVAGAYGDNNGSYTRAGSAYIYKRTGTAWGDEFKLNASDPAKDDFYGFSVSISGDSVVVGARQNDDDGFNSGSAYVYERNGTTWGNEVKLTASDAAQLDGFGNSVSIDGTRIVVGAYSNDDVFNNTGSAYVFDKIGSSWVEHIDKLLNSNMSAYSYFGQSVSVKGDNVLVGTFRDDPISGSPSNTGSATLFMLENNSWVAKEKYRASDGVGNDLLGFSVDLASDFGVAGAYQNDTPVDRAGAAYIFNIVNDETPPSLVVNKPLIVSQSLSAVITADELSASDSETDDATIVYTVSSLPVNGTLENNGVTLVVNDMFTQGDIDANLINYTHNGSSTMSDSFGFDVADTNNNVLSGEAFTIIIHIGDDMCDIGLTHADYFLIPFGTDVADFACDAAVEHTGTGSLELISVPSGVNDSFGIGGEILLDEPVNIGVNDTLHYWVMSNQNSPIEIAIEIEDATSSPPNMDTNVWTQLNDRITLADCNGVWTKVSTTIGFGLDFTKIEKIRFLLLRGANSTTSSTTLHIDDISFTDEFVAPDPSIFGEWSRDIIQSDNIVPVHLILLPTGKVLFFENGISDPVNPPNMWDLIRIWDPATETLSVPTPPDPGYDIFCAGQSLLSDGKLFLTGGHANEDFYGVADSVSYDPFTDSWIPGPVMNDGRWYPTSITLGNGDVVIVSGSIDGESTQNSLPQVYDFITGTLRDLTGANELGPIGHEDLLYPRLFQIPDGRVYRADPDGAAGQTYYLDVTGTGDWTNGPQTNYAGERSYGPAVLYEDANDDINILICGGGFPTPTDTVEVINMEAPTPAWRYVDSMEYARRHNNATLLPDGTVLVTGGTEAPLFNDWTGAIKAAELWDPVTETWTTLASMQAPRVYHSTAILLPDGRVLTGGGGRPTPVGYAEQSNFEIFSPPYLFQGPRPTITSAPTSVDYSEVFTVTTPEAANITLMTFIRLGAATHAFDHNTRLLRLSFTTGSGSLSVTAPSAGNRCPPGHYMLFIVDNNGVPSVGEIIQID